MDARQETEETIARTFAAACENWKSAALYCGRRLARTQPCLTSQDVRDDAAIYEPANLEPRALGGIMRKLASEGLIENTHKYVSLEQRHNNCRPQAIWRSLIFKGE